MHIEEKKDCENQNIEGSRFREEIFSKVVRAGKRTYFFDVKTTRRDELYFTITESKKKEASDGKFFYEKHKIFLYPEDFEKFSQGLSEVVEYINNNQKKNESSEDNSNVLAEFSSVKFEDL